MAARIKERIERLERRREVHEDTNDVYGDDGPMDVNTKRDKSPVECEVQRLTAVLDDLSEQLGQLASRLGPILQNAPVEGDCEMAEEERYLSSCPLGQSLHRLANLSLSIRDRIVYIRTHLEV